MTLVGYEQEIITCALIDHKSVSTDNKLNIRPTLERRKTLGHIRSINPNMIID